MAGERESVLAPSMLAFCAGEEPGLRFVGSPGLLEFGVDTVAFTLRAEEGAVGEHTMVLVGVIDGLAEVLQAARLGLRLGFAEVDSLAALQHNIRFRLPHVVTATVGTEDDSLLIWESERSTLRTEHTGSR